jgi:hypothetical protein
MYWEWDLLANATRFEKMISYSPSTEQITMLSLLLPPAMVSAVNTLVLIVGICSSKSVRSQPFNLFALAVVAPNFVFTGYVSMVGIKGGIHQELVSTGAQCELTQFISTFMVSANFWMQLVTANEIRKVIVTLRKLECHQPLSTQSVLVKVGAAYAWSSFLGLWALIDLVPIKTGQSV